VKSLLVLKMMFRPFELRIVPQVLTLPLGSHYTAVNYRLDSPAGVLDFLL